MTIPNLNQFIGEYYPQASEDRKRSMATLIITNLMLIFLTGTWIPIILLLDMPEVLWVNTGGFIGNIFLFLSIVFFLDNLPISTIYFTTYRHRTNWNFQPVLWY